MPADAEEVSLEQCIDGYFTDETVYDHKCTSCKKLVEATKTTRFTEMPPNIILSVNRTDASGAKICTPIRVTTGSIDFRRWCRTNEETTRRPYELSSMVEHQGDSAANGKYSATCRIHGSGKEQSEGTDEVRQDQWRTIEDEEVSSPTRAEKMSERHRDGQLFFLQKLG